uniref:Cold stress protein-like protein n=1 Tax=Wolffia arrhiza TaxID=161111 RepID=D2JYS0_WOLAR|nr:cold stress protein-like protein [Wolffia arrhiza]
MSLADRRVGVAVDFSPCSKEALRWAGGNVVRDGDHLILLNVQKDGANEGGEVQLWKGPGSPFIPLNELSDPGIHKKYGIKPDEETLDILRDLAKEIKVEIILKVYWGDPREKILEAADHIPLSCLIIGNRGFGKLKRVLMGSVSNYIVNNAACPVTVVKHSQDA